MSYEKAIIITYTFSDRKGIGNKDRSPPHPPHFLEPTFRKVKSPRERGAGAYTACCARHVAETSSLKSLWRYCSVPKFDAGRCRSDDGGTPPEGGPRPSSNSPRSALTLSETKTGGDITSSRSPRDPRRPGHAPLRAPLLLRCPRRVSNPLRTPTAPTCYPGWSRPSGPHRREAT